MQRGGFSLVGENQRLSVVVRGRVNNENDPQLAKPLLAQYCAGKSFPRP